LENILKSGETSTYNLYSKEVIAKIKYFNIGCTIYITAKVCTNGKNLTLIFYW